MTEMAVHHDRVAGLRFRVPRFWHLETDDGDGEPMELFTTVAMRPEGVVDPLNPQWAARALEEERRLWDEAVNFNAEDEGPDYGASAPEQSSLSVGTLPVGTLRLLREEAADLLYDVGPLWDGDEQVEMREDDDYDPSPGELLLLAAEWLASAYGPALRFLPEGHVRHAKRLFELNGHPAAEVTSAYSVPPDGWRSGYMRVVVVGLPDGKTSFAIGIAVPNIDRPLIDRMLDELRPLPYLNSGAEGDLLYFNPLVEPSDIADFRVEGDAAVSFPLGRLRLESTRPAGDGQAANIVLWCPEEFPADVTISWDFWPIREPGLCILFFHARGHGDRDLFHPGLARRTGPYEQYHSGDIDAYHVSYFRRMWESERRLHTCNLRKSHGFHLVAQGADPLPGVLDARAPYQMKLSIHNGEITFAVEEVVAFHWRDDGSVGGPALRGGKIGFRQMAPMIGEYANLRVVRA